MWPASLEIGSFGHCVCFLYVRVVSIWLSFISIHLNQFFKPECLPIAQLLPPFLRIQASRKINFTFTLLILNSLSDFRVSFLTPLTMVPLKLPTSWPSDLLAVTPSDVESTFTCCLSQSFSQAWQCWSLPVLGAAPLPWVLGRHRLSALCLLSGPSCHRHRSPSLYPAPQCWRSSELLPRTCVRILSFSQATWLHSPPLSPQTSLLSSRLLQPTARYTRLRLPTGRSQLACPTLKASSTPPAPPPTWLLF